MMLDLRRRAVFVDAQKGDVEIVSREFEVVWIAAEERDVGLRREHQANVRVLPVLIEVVHPARVQRDHVAAQPAR